MSFLERLPLLLAACAACTPFRPAFTQPPGVGAQTDPHQATVVFLWPATSCDPAGHLTLATADGTFIGNLSRGSRISALVPPGERTVVAWNDIMEAAHGGWMSKASVPALRADLREGRTYYVRIAFGEWDHAGPPEPGLREGTIVVRGNSSYSARRCVGDSEGMTSAMVVLSPSAERWHDLPEWMAELEVMVPDRAAGQAWLDANRALLESHLLLGQEHFAALRPQGKRLATIDPADGSP